MSQNEESKCAGQGAFLASLQQPLASVIIGLVNLLTQSAYARHRKISRQRVFQLIKAGRIELVNGLIDVGRADASLERKPTGAKNGRRFKPATNKPTRWRECIYQCDRCSLPISMNRYTPLPARLICPSCGTEVTVVDLAELKTK
jgi:hypothetical protein